MPPPLLPVSWLLLTTCAQGGVVAQEEAAPRPDQPPNFVVILIDDLGYGDISPFASTRNATPNLDRMAAGGMRFTSFYAPASACTPARASLMTGCYPHRVGLATGSRFGVLLPGDPWGLHPDEVTIAEVLKERGYATGLFGKWHLGDQPEFLPTRQGFDEYFGIPYSHDMSPEGEPHWPVREEGPWRFPPLPLLRQEAVVEAVQGAEAFSQLGRRFTEEAVEFIRGHHEQPFFLCLSQSLVHRPRYPRPEFLEQADDAVEAQVEEVDWCVGEVLRTLEELDLTRNTLVLFTSDHGAAVGGESGALRGAKGSVWEGGVRVPTLAMWPGQVPAGATCDEMAGLMDLLPTLARLGGASLPAARVIDGQDLTPLLRGEEGARSSHEVMYFYRAGRLVALRSGPWKVVYWALFRLDRDLAESVNLADQHPRVFTSLRQELFRGRARLGDADVEGRDLRPVGRVDDPRTLLPRRPSGAEEDEGRDRPLIPRPGTPAPADADGGPPAGPRR